MDGLVRIGAADGFAQQWRQIRGIRRVRIAQLVVTYGSCVSGM